MLSRGEATVDSTPRTSLRVDATFQATGSRLLVSTCSKSELTSAVSPPPPPTLHNSPPSFQEYCLRVDVGRPRWNSITWSPISQWIQKIRSPRMFYTDSIHLFQRELCMDFVNQNPSNDVCNKEFVIITVKDKIWEKHVHYFVYGIRTFKF